MVIFINPDILYPSNVRQICYSTSLVLDPSPGNFRNREVSGLRVGPWGPGLHYFGNSARKAIEKHPPLPP